MPRSKAPDTPKGGWLGPNTPGGGSSDLPANQRKATHVASGVTKKGEWRWKAL